METNKKIARISICQHMEKTPEKFQWKYNLCHDRFHWKSGVYDVSVVCQCAKL